jgi:hypothetical protein
MEGIVKKILLVIAVAMSLVAANAEARGGWGWHNGGRFFFYGALTAPLWYSAWAYSRPWYYYPAPVYVQSAPTYYVAQPSYVTQPSYVVANSQPNYVISQSTVGASQSSGVIELGPANGSAPPQPQQVQPAITTLPAPESVQGGRWFVYPSRGQSQAQLAADRSQCNGWAIGQSGYDPDLKVHRNPETGPSDYGRALSACLEGRGYTVR